MKRILEENEEQRFVKYCKECSTTFDYQKSDVETYRHDYTDKSDYWETKYCHEKKFVTCPKCGKEIILIDKHWSE